MRRAGGGGGGGAGVPSYMRDTAASYKRSASTGRPGTYAPHKEQQSLENAVASLKSTIDTYDDFLH